MTLIGNDGVAWICDIDYEDIEEGYFGNGDTVDCLGICKFDKLDYPLAEHITEVNLYDNPEDLIIDDNYWYLAWSDDLEEIYQNALQEKSGNAVFEETKEYRIKGKLV